MRRLSMMLLPACLVAGLAGAALAQDEPVSAPGPLSAAEFELADFQGSVVLVDFWASWCVPCRQSLPWLNEMQQKYKDQGLQVVMINLDKNPRAAAEMAAAIHGDIRQHLDPDGELAARYELEGMPSTYLFDRSGALVSSHLGFLKTDGPKREKALQALLAKEAE